MDCGNTNEDMWKEICLIMEQDYTTNDPVSPGDIQSGKIIRNPADDGEHPYADAPKEPEPEDSTEIIDVKIEDIKLSISNKNGSRTPWGDIPQLYYMLPYYNTRGYHEWIDCNMLILINRRYSIVYHLHSAYDGHQIRGSRQDQYRQKLADAVTKYLFDPQSGRMRYGKTLSIIIDKSETEEIQRADLVDGRTYNHNFP